MSLHGQNIAKQLREFDETERKLQISKALALQNAVKSGDVDAIFKAQNYYQQQSLKNDRYKSPIEGMKSIMVDPYDMSMSNGYYVRSSGLTGALLRNMARTPVVAAILKTRKDQIGDFLKPQPDKYSNGFKFVKKGVDSEDELTDQDKRIIEYLTNFIIHCGVEDNQWDLDDFDTFGKKLLVDSLIGDFASFEVIPSRSGKPSMFVAVDGATMRFADTANNDVNRNERARVNGYLPKYVQVIDGIIKAEFYPWEMCYGIRNPSTDIYSNGYGTSELEILISTVTNLLNADRYNGSIFKTGSSPKGALFVKKGNIQGDAIQQIRRDWQAMLAGAENNGRTLILDAENVDWVDMQKSNRDMEYSAFYELMIKLACAVYTISPEEIGFPLQGSNKGGLGSKEAGKQEKDYSINKGLKPLLTYQQTWINKYLIYPLTNKQFEFQFAGLEVESAAEEEERLIKAAAVYLTPDEIRAGKKLKPLPNGVGKYPLSPIIAQQIMGQQQNQQEQDSQDAEKEEERQANTNPFLMEEDSPFQKAFDEFFETKYVME